MTDLRNMIQHADIVTTVRTYPHAKSQQNQNALLLHFVYSYTENWIEPCNMINMFVYVLLFSTNQLSCISNMLSQCFFETYYVHLQAIIPSS